MTAPRPQLDIDFLNLLAGMLARNEQPTEFQLAQYRRQGEALLGTDSPEWVWVARTAIAAASWKLPELKDLFRRGLPQVRQDAALLRNLSVSFKHANLLDESADCTRIAYELDPLSVSNAIAYSDDLFMLGRVREAASVLDSFCQRAGPDHSGPVLTKLSQLRRTIEGLDRAGATEEQLQREMSACLEVLRELRTRFDELTVDTVEDPEDQRVTAHVRIRFIGDIDDEIRLGAALAGRLCEMEEWNPSILNVEYTYSRLEDANATA